MNKLFVDICQPDKEMGFVLISGKNELCATSYSTNLGIKQIWENLTSNKCAMMKLTPGSDSSLKNGSQGERQN